MAKQEGLTLSIDKSGIPGGLKVTLAGSLDAETSAVLSDKLYPLIHKEIKLVIDLAAVEFINSPGWGTLVILAKEVHNNSGKIAICGMIPGVEKIYQMLCLAPILPSCPGPAEAAALVNK